MMKSVLALGVLCVPSVLGQQVQPREVSCEGAASSNEGVWESAIAAPLNPGPGLSDSEMVSVYVGPKYHKVGFSRARKNGAGQWEWELEGTIAHPPTSDFQNDPTIVYNRITGDYVVGGIMTAPGDTPPEEDACATVADYPAWAHYHPARAPFSQPWTSLNAPGLGKVFEPYLVGGRMDAAQQVFYLLCSKDLGGCSGRPHCLRSSDGGYTFTNTGPISPTLTGWVIPTTTPAAPDKLWVATWDESTTEFRFYEGDDNLDSITWSPLLKQDSPVDPPVPLTVPLSAPYLYSHEPTSLKYLPLPAGHRRVRTFPNIVADPQDPNIIHLVYHDLAEIQPTPTTDMDVNVFYRKLTRNPTSGFWTVTASQQVNPTNPAQGVADDFLPSVVVTPRAGQSSIIHIAYYSDRRVEFVVQTDTTATNPNATAKFDAYYAHTHPVTGEWVNQRLFRVDDPSPSVDPPGVDWNLVTTFGFSQFRMRDRLGICVHDADPTAAGYTIEIGWMGTNPEETPYESHPSCVWWSQVVWAQ